MSSEPPRETCQNTDTDERRGNIDYDSWPRFFQRLRKGISSPVGRSSEMEEVLEREVHVRC